MRRAAGRVVARRRGARKRAGGARRRAGVRSRLRRSAREDQPAPGAKVGGCAVAMVMISVRSPCSEGIANFLGDEVAVTAVVEQSAGVVEELADGDPAAVGDEA